MCGGDCSNIVICTSLLYCISNRRCVHPIMWGIDISPFFARAVHYGAVVLKTAFSQIGFLAFFQVIRKVSCL